MLGSDSASSLAGTAGACRRAPQVVDNTHFPSPSLYPCNRLPNRSSDAVEAAEATLSSSPAQLLHRWPHILVALFVRRHPQADSYSLHEACNSSVRQGGNYLRREAVVDRHFLQWAESYGHPVAVADNCSPQVDNYLTLVEVADSYSVQQVDSCLAPLREQDDNCSVLQADSYFPQDDNCWAVVSHAPTMEED